MNATLSITQMQALRALRSLPADVASTVRASLFASFKAGFGIPAEHKLKVEIDDFRADNYGVLLRKKTGDAYPLGVNDTWVGDVQVAAPPPAKAWFRVDMDSAVDAIVGDLDFDDGDPTLDDPTVFNADGYDMATSDGTLYVRLSEDKF